MPCMGPDYNMSVEQAKQALDNLLINLECQFNVKRPVVQHGSRFFASFSKSSQVEWDDKVKELQELLTELCWIDACDNF